MAVYFVRARDAVKIGYAADPYGRMAYLQTGNPVRLQMIRLIEGGDVEERAAHRHFSRLRLERRSEWFHYSPAMLEYGDPLPLKVAGASLPFEPSDIPFVARIQAWIAEARVPLAHIAANAGLDEKTIRLALSRDWNPTARTMVKLEAVMTAIPAELRSAA